MHSSGLTTAGGLASLAPAQFAMFGAHEQQGPWSMGMVARPPSGSIAYPTASEGALGAKLTVREAGPTEARPPSGVRPAGCSCHNDSRGQANQLPQERRC